MFDLFNGKIRTRRAAVDRIIAPIETVEPEPSVSSRIMDTIWGDTSEIGREISMLEAQLRGIVRLPRAESDRIRARIKELKRQALFGTTISPVERGILEEVVKRKQNRVINETINTMPRLRLEREDRFPFNAIRQPVAFPLTPEPLKKTRIVPGGAQVTTVTKAVAIRAIQPPETIQPGATVDGELLETTQVPPAPVEAGMPTFVDVALGLESPVLKYGLIALGVGLFAWSVMDTKKKTRRRSR